MHLCGLNRKRAAEKWGLIPDETKKEVAEFVHLFQFPGQGNKAEPVITFKGVLKLVMMVTGQKAALYRSAMVSILSRYYAGDGSLTEEIEANAKSSAPIPQMARASLAAEAGEAPAQDEFSLTHKRKLLELEISRQELEISRQEQAIARQKVETELDITRRKIEDARMKEELEILKRDSMREHIVKCTASYRELCDEDEVMDERACLILKDNLLNMVMVQGAITNGEDHKPISISLIANEKKMRIPSEDFQSIGIELRKRYLEKHGKPPGKHDELVKGKMLQVNSYTNTDRPLFDEVFAWYAAKKAAAV